MSEERYKSIVYLEKNGELIIIPYEHVVFIDGSQKFVKVIKDNVDERVYFDNFITIGNTDIDELYSDNKEELKKYTGYKNIYIRKDDFSC